jgi:hypothetical protein
MSTGPGLRTPRVRSACDREIALGGRDTGGVPRVASGSERTQVWMGLQSSPRQVGEARGPDTALHPGGRAGAIGRRRRGPKFLARVFHRHAPSAD